MPEDFHDPFGVGEFVVEPRLNRISRGSEHHTVRPQAMDLLVYLALRKGQVVSADKLIDDVWDGVTVSSGSVYNCINELRAAFGDDPHNPVYLETIPKRGYRLIAPVRFFEEQDDDSSAQAAISTKSKPDRRRVMGLAGLLALALVAVFYQLTKEATIPGLPVAKRSIAVLPFKDLSPDGDQEYFTDGITEELLNTLAGVDGLQVAARISSFYFKDARPSVREIGQTLGVAHILEGSVRRTGDRIRITAQLIDADSGFHLWSQTYDRELGDIFNIQDEISVAIVDALRDKLDLGSGEIGNPKASKAVNLEAYSEYLLGRHRMNRRTPDDFDAALEHFQNAMKLDESYAPPYANMAITYGLLFGYTDLPQDEAFELAKPFANRAIQLDPELAEAHAAMYYLEFISNTPDPDFKYLNRAIALNPSYMDARNWKAGELERWHRIEEAFALNEASLKIDPLSIIHNINYGNNLLQLGRRDEAKAVAERLQSIDSGWGQRITGNIAYAAGDLAAAIEAYLSGLRSVPRHGPLIARLALVLSELGLGGEAGRLFPHPRTVYYNSRNRGDWALVLNFAREGLEEAGDADFYIPALAEALYFNRDFEAAAIYYDQILPEDPAPGYIPRYLLDEGYIFYAGALRAIGGLPRAEEVFEEALNIIAARGRGGYVDGPFFQLKGQTLLYQGRIEEALDAFELAFEAGYRHPWEFAAPLFDPLREHLRFLALVGKYETAGRENSAAVLALICVEDLPDFGWQPLPETCAEFATAASN